MAALNAIKSALNKSDVFILIEDVSFLNPLIFWASSCEINTKDWSISALNSNIPTTFNVADLG